MRCLHNAKTNYKTICPGLLFITSIHSLTKPTRFVMRDVRWRREVAGRTGMGGVWSRYGMEMGGTAFRFCVTYVHHALR
jgi:hypothetical protein